MNHKRAALKRSTIAVVATCLTLPVAPARADFLSDFYNDAGAAMNYTAMGAYQTQAGSAYVGPSISMRVPQKTLHPFSVVAPSVRANCGSIDAIAGSFGFVNETQMVNFIRNIGQAAPAYFFQLAMRSVAPEIAATLDVLNDLAQKFNQFGMNGCQALQTAFGDTNSKADVDSANRAAAWKVDLGTAADWATAWMPARASFADRYQAQADRIAQNKPGTVNADGSPVDPLAKFNVVWNSLRQMQGVNFGNTEDVDYMQMMMSLTGTLVNRYDPTTSPPERSGRYDWVPPTITNVWQLLGEPSGTTTIRMLSCGSDTTVCEDPQAVDYVTQRGFLRMVYEDLVVLRDSIVAKSITDQVRYDEALRLLGMTSVPAYRIIAASTRGSFASLSDVMIEHIAQVVATDIAATFADRALSDLAKALGTNSERLSGLGSEKIAQINERIRDVREQLGRQRQHANDATNRVVAYIQQVEHLERAFYSNASMQIAANLRFGQR